MHSVIVLSEHHHCVDPDSNVEAHQPIQRLHVQRSIVVKRGRKNRDDAGEPVTHETVAVEDTSPECSKTFTSGSPSRYRRMFSMKRSTRRSFS